MPVNLLHWIGGTIRRLRAWLLLGGAGGALAFAVLTLVTVLCDSQSKPSFLPLFAVFWICSASPIYWLARILLGSDNVITRFGLVPSAVGVWIALGAAVGGLIGLKHRNRPLSIVKVDRWSSALRPKRRFLWSATLGILLLLFWPIRVPISGSTTIKIVHPDGSPYVDVPVQEKWYVEGYDVDGCGEVGEQEEIRTDETGRRFFRLAWCTAGLDGAK